MVNGNLQYGIPLPQKGNLAEVETFRRPQLLQKGFRKLPYRKLRLAGKRIQGEILPKTVSSQILILKLLQQWYTPCIQRQQNRFKMNEDCFAKKQKQFLRLRAKHMSDLRFKYIL